MAQFFSWIMTATSLMGTVLNARQKVTGFYLWIIANVYIMVTNYRAGLYAQSFLFLVNTLISIHGIKVWKQKEKELNEEKLETIPEDEE